MGIFGHNEGDKKNEADKKKKVKKTKPMSVEEANRIIKADNDRRMYEISMKMGEDSLRARFRYDERKAEEAIRRSRAYIDKVGFDFADGIVLNRIADDVDREFDELDRKRAEVDEDFAKAKAEKEAEIEAKKAKEEAVQKELIKMMLGSKGTP